jgi:hypothetical protein
MDQILVGLEISRGLVEIMEIIRGIDVCHLTLDYKVYPLGVSDSTMIES